MEICEQNKTKGWQHIYPGPFRHHQYIFMYLHTYIFVLLWRGVFSVASLNGLSFGKKKNERETRRKVFYFQHNENYALIRRNKFQSYFQENLRGIIYYMLIF